MFRSIQSNLCDRIPVTGFINRLCLLAQELSKYEWDKQSGYSGRPTLVLQK